MLFENKYEPLLSIYEYRKRIKRMSLIAITSTIICLLIGIVGYHYSANISWIDSLLNASMILSGMGPVNEITTFMGKLFSSFYAIFSGVMFVTNISIFFAPIIHRYLHKLHLEE